MKKPSWLLLSLALLPMSLAAQQPAAGGRGGRGGGGRGGGGRAGNGDTANEPAMNRPRPIATRDDVWMENLTWMEVRDAIQSGKKTIAIIPAGSQEQNGPYVVNGKSTFIVKADAEAIAKHMG